MWVNYAATLSISVGNQHNLRTDSRGIHNKLRRLKYILNYCGNRMFKINILVTIYFNYA